MPPRRRPFDAVVRAAERGLSATRVDHVFVGALSVIAFGVPRTTVDVDVLADFRPRHVPGMRTAFRRRGFAISEGDLRTALEEGGHCTIQDRRSAYRIDLAPVADPAAEHAMSDRVWVPWRGVRLPIAGPGHTIVMKLKFGSDQDLEDALGIYHRQRDAIDLGRMRSFARQQRVGRALRDLEREGRSPGSE